MFRKTLLLGAAAFMAGSSAIAMAQDAPAQPASPAPAEAAKADGAKDEAPARPQVRGAVMFWLLDRNGDGKIDKAEIDALRSVVFDTMDTDSDGRISKEEFSAVMERGPRGPGPRGWRHHQHRDWSSRGDDRRGDWGHRGWGPRRDWSRDDGPRGGWHRGPGPDERRERAESPRRGDFAEKRAERVMDRLGYDAEAGVSKSDFLAKQPRALERADRDEDGAISQEEFRGGARFLERMLR